MQRQQKFKRNKQYLIQFTKNDKIDTYRPARIIQLITQQNLLKMQRLMKQHPLLNVSQFLRLLTHILSTNIPSQDYFYLLYGLFLLFKQLCLSSLSPLISFSTLSTYITSSIPIKQKLLPIGLSISKQDKSKIIPPQIQGKLTHQRQLIEPVPKRFDKYQHTNRTIKQVQYSKQYQYFFTIDLPDNSIRIMDSSFNQVAMIESELQISKKQSVINYIAWSQTQGRLAAILGNYSISFWAKQDNFRFEVNVPLSSEYYSSPFVMIGYMQSIRTWYTLDNYPVIYILSSVNFQPMHKIRHFKVKKVKYSQKLHCIQMGYQKLLCLGFQRCIHLLSLQTREVLSSVTLPTSLTSMCFSQTYQALFISTYEIHFNVYQLSQHCDLTFKGRFQGHKRQIVLLGIREERPLVYSVEEGGLMKLWDIRDFTCFQTIQVLKNIQYRQILTVNNGVTLVGSKLYFYQWADNNNQQNKLAPIDSNNQNKNEPTTIQHKKNENKLKIVLMTSIQKNILIISSQNIKVYSYHSGSLLKVIKGIFPQSSINFAYVHLSTKHLYLSTLEGDFSILQTQTYTPINSFTFLQHPLHMNYSIQQDLFTMVGMGELRILNWKEDNIQIKRTIINHQQKVMFVRVQENHNLIVIIYGDGQQIQNYIYFYCYQKTKPLGYFKVKDVVNIELHPQRNALFILQGQTLLIYSFERTISSISFSLYYQIQLWQNPMIDQTLTQQFIQYSSKVLQVALCSFKLLLFQQSIVILSNYSCLFLNLPISFCIFDLIKPHPSTYNPHRIAMEDHCLTFQYRQQSKIENITRQQIKLMINYNLTKAYAETVQAMRYGSNFVLFNSKMDIHFFNLKFQLLGLIHHQATLPKIWNMHSYEISELVDIQFVLDYMQNQAQSKASSNINEIFKLTLNHSSNLAKKSSILTVQKLLKSSLLQPLVNRSKSYSLRERKLMLQKQRQQRQRLQNFLQHQQQQQQNNLLSTNNEDHQNNISQILNFFSINRNQMVKNKGIIQKEYPKVKTFQRKLINAVKLDQKKSKNSDNQPRYQHKIIDNIILKTLNHTNNFNSKISLGSFKMFQSLELDQRSPYKQTNIQKLSQKKVLLKKLDDEVKKSKFTRQKRSFSNTQSLPSLKKF